MTEKRLKPLIHLGLSLLKKYDSGGARTHDLYPVKVALSQLSYGIVNIGQVLFYYVCV